MKNQVFFFGAGASISEGGLPTSKLLFESLKNPRVDHRLVSSIIRFLKDLFSIENINGLKSAKCLPSFEELLTIVDVAILKQEESLKILNFQTIGLRKTYGRFGKL